MVGGDDARTEVRIASFDPASDSVDDVTPAQLEGSDVSTANLLVVDGRLGLWVERLDGDTRQAQLLLADPPDSIGVHDVTWHATDVDLAGEGRWPGLPWSRPVWSIGLWIAFPDQGLTWYNTETGTNVEQTLTSRQRCATDETAAVTVDDVVVAWTSPCVFIDDDGYETMLTGAYLFHPPDTATG